MPAFFHNTTHSVSSTSSPKVAIIPSTTYQIPSGTTTCQPTNGPGSTEQLSLHRTSTAGPSTNPLDGPSLESSTALKLSLFTKLVSYTTPMTITDSSKTSTVAPASSVFPKSLLATSISGGNSTSLILPTETPGAQALQQSSHHILSITLAFVPAVLLTLLLYLFLLLLKSRARTRHLAEQLQVYQQTSNRFCVSDLEAEQPLLPDAGELYELWSPVGPEEDERRSKQLERELEGVSWLAEMG
jgi:hypothetical protein